MKLVVLDGHALNPGDLSWEKIGEFGDLTVYDRTASEQETIERIGDAPIVITNKTPVTEAVLEACPGVRLIAVIATGYNVVDCAAARKRGIPVCNVPAYGTAAVAQYTMALLLELCHHVGHHDLMVHRGRWEASPDFCCWDYPLTELEGLTLGILGYGRIGQRVGCLARAFGMEVLVSTPHPRQEPGVEFVDRDTLFARSDVISLHCPLFPETEHIICGDTIARMKEGVILLNTSRGGLVDEQALAEALNRGRVGAAAVDVVSREPILGSNPLLKAKNCIITPHIAWASTGCRQRILDCTEENIRSFLTGTPIHVVNP